jgi:16S rRNA (uracil1498-N3)-methyltransferase
MIIDGEWYNGMYRFYVNKSSCHETTVSITGGDVNHIKNVLRMHAGEKITACDGEGKDYICSISSITQDEVIADIETIKKSKGELLKHIVLYQGLPKKDKMELIIQKMVELGVNEIVPVMTKRTIVKLDDEKKETKKLERWNEIARAAAMQSERGIIPKVSPAMAFKTAVCRAVKRGSAIIPYELEGGIARSQGIIDEICGDDAADEIGIFIGPEGGFEESEVAFANESGIKSVTLGHRILRTETAGMCTLSVIMFKLEKD